jgi:anaerobic magnesium-protoporphyrin IX monomethyl ester cyclase
MGILHVVPSYREGTKDMKVTLISLDEDLYCVGVRILSASLRRAGHQVQCIFLPPRVNKGTKTPKFKIGYTSELLDEVLSLCVGSDLVGLSLMTNQFIQATSLTQHLKKHQMSAPIIWGGIQPTAEPEVCLEYTDIVCLGEGEEALLELVDHMEQGRSYLETRNMWFKLKDGIIRNPIRPLVQDLDTIPFPDYSCENHFIGQGDRIEVLTKDDLVQFEGARCHKLEHGVNYPMMTSRGCPFACTYCCNDVYKRLYPKQKHLRWRSVDNVISELQMIQKEIAPLSFVTMVDDNFTARKQRELELFCERYRTEIGVPFACQCSPLTITQEKMDILLDAGCAKIVMGIETGSERIANMYNRGRFHKAVPAAISLIEKYRSRMPLPPAYQFIIDNPYETLEETLDTLQLAVSLPRPRANPIYSLMLFPGTELYERAQQDGLIEDKFSQIYARNWHDQSKPFFRFWIRLYRAGVFPLLLRALLLPWIARLLSSDFADSVWKMPIFRWLWDKPIQ